MQVSFDWIFVDYLFADGLGISIAEILNLPNPEKFTGHCFRRTSSTLMADGGATSVDLKRYAWLLLFFAHHDRKFGWKSDKTASEYVDRSQMTLKRDANMISGANKERDAEKKQKSDFELPDIEKFGRNAANITINYNY